MDFRNKYQEETDFKDLLRNPIRWFAVTYPYFVVVLVGLGLYYIASFEAISSNETPAMIIDSTVFKQKIEKKPGKEIEGVDVIEVTTPSDEMKNKGEEIYQANCASCHGDEGKGNGPAGEALNPLPRNLLEKDGWKNGRGYAGIYKTLEEGIPGSGMAAYDYMPIKDRFAVIQYIRSFAEFPEPEEDELKNLEREYKLSESRTVPPQIPVSLAMQILSDGGPIQADAPDTVDIHDFELPTGNYFEMVGSRANSGSNIFSRFSIDEEKSKHFLSADNRWRGDLNRFIEFVSNSAPYNGFKIGISRLSKQEWNDLYIYAESLQ